MEEELKQRYFMWSLEQAQIEYASNFELLRGVRSANVYSFLEFFESLNNSDQLNAQIAFVKRFNHPSIHQDSTILTERERKLVDSYLNYYATIDATGRGAYSAKGSRKERRFWDEVESKKLPLGVRQLSKKLKMQIGDALGKLRPGSGNVVIYDLIDGEWFLSTVIDINRSNHRVDYSHSIGLVGNKPSLSFISPCSWLGISSETDWTLFTEIEVDTVAHEMAIRMKWFAERWRAILPPNASHVAARPV